MKVSPWKPERSKLFKIQELISSRFVSKVIVEEPIKMSSTDVDFSSENKLRFNTSEPVLISKEFGKNFRIPANGRHPSTRVTFSTLQVGFM